MVCVMQKAPFVEVALSNTVLGVLLYKSKRTCASAAPLLLCPGHPRAVPTFHANLSSFSVQGRKCGVTSHYTFCCCCCCYLRFVITQYPENITNEKIFVAAIYTGTSQFLQNIQQQEAHHSHFSDKSTQIRNIDCKNSF